MFLSINKPKDFNFNKCNQILKVFNFHLKEENNDNSFF